AGLIRAWQPPHGEFDAVAWQLTPRFDFRHIGGLGKAAEEFARLLARCLARQREGFAAEAFARACAAGERLAGAPGDVGGAAGGVHVWTRKASSLAHPGRRSESRAMRAESLLSARRGIGNGRKRCLFQRKSRSDPRLLRRAQRSAEPRPPLDAARQEIR